MLMSGAENRNPTKFGQPNTFDIARRYNRTLPSTPQIISALEIRSRE